MAKEKSPLLFVPTIPPRGNPKRPCDAKPKPDWLHGTVGTPEVGRALRRVVDYHTGNLQREPQTGPSRVELFAWGTVIVLLLSFSYYNFTKAAAPEQPAIKTIPLNR